MPPIKNFLPIYLFIFILFQDTAHAFPHLANAFKYATTFFVTAAQALMYQFSARDEYLNDWQNPFFYLWLVVAAGATLYKLWWDYKMDWGFFDDNAGENRFLRETIVYSSKNYYYFAIIQNFVLRFAWLIGDMKKEKKIFFIL